MKAHECLSLAYGDLRDAQLWRGSHYEISFIVERPEISDEVVAASLKEFGFWLGQPNENSLEFGDTVKFVDKLIVAVVGRSANRVQRKLKSTLLSLSIYSPEFANAQTH